MKEAAFKTRFLGTVLFSVLAAALVLGCAAREAAPPSGYEKIKEIQPSSIHEDCVEILETQKLECVFESSMPLDFNIHYHEDGEVVYPVVKKHVAFDRSEFQPEKSQYYCLMWTNRHMRPVTLGYEYRVSGK